MIAYKLVIKGNDKIFRSFRVNHQPKILRRYHIGKTNKARIGPMFCFDSLGMATSWGNSFLLINGFSILRCEVIESKLRPTTIPYDASDTVFKKSKFWKVVKKGEAILGNMKVPPGTVFCDSVTPLEIVK